MHRPRPAVLLALGVAAAVVLPGVGSSRNSPKRAGDQCTTAVFQNELEAVFGHVRTANAAQVLLGRVRRVGFSNADIIRASCTDYKVFQRGVETWDVGVDLQSEARRVGLPVIWIRTEHGPWTDSESWLGRVKTENDQRATAAVTRERFNCRVTAA